MYIIACVYIYYVDDVYRARQTGVDEFLYNILFFFYIPCPREKFREEDKKKKTSLLNKVAAIVSARRDEIVYIFGASEDATDCVCGYICGERQTGMHSAKIFTEVNPVSSSCDKNSTTRVCVYITGCCGFYANWYISV